MLQLEEQVSRLQREKNDLQSRMEEDQEDMNELMKKHKAAVAQVTTCLTPRWAARKNLREHYFQNPFVINTQTYSSMQDPTLKRSETDHDRDRKLA